MKIAINSCYGGFSLSSKALDLYKSYKGIEPQQRIQDFDIERDDLILIKVIEELKEAANVWVSDLKIVEIPDGVEWLIQDYDGLEWVAQKHMTWS